MDCIVVALKNEVVSFLDLLTGIQKIRVNKLVIYEGLMGEKNIRVVKTGPGRKDLVYDIFKGCSRVLSTGFCGGLTQELKTGDIVVSKEVLYTEKQVLESIFTHQIPHDTLPGTPVQKISYKENFLAEVEKELSEKSVTFHRGRTLTAERVIKSFREKDLLHSTTKAIAVDMEDYHRLLLSKKLSLPFFSIRVVLDEIQDDIPGFKKGFHSFSNLSSLLKKLSTAQQRIALLLDKIVR
jgi:nucleoside phosphorylase